MGAASMQARLRDGVGAGIPGGGGLPSSTVT